MTTTKPTVTTLCGSSRFKDEFASVNRDLTLAGEIVISLGLFGHADHPPLQMWQAESLTVSYEAHEIASKINAGLEPKEAFAIWPRVEHEIRVTVHPLKAMLDDLHKRKIDLSDGIFVVNPGGYIGESTRGEIAYAVDHGKTVRYLEPVA